MSLVTDIRSVSESAMEQIADQFDDLPRPLLAAIGAGDLAVQSLAALRQSLMEQVATTTVDADGDLGRVSDSGAQVAVDFTLPSVTEQNVHTLVDRGVHVVVGTNNADGHLVLIEMTAGNLIKRNVQLV